MPPWARGGFSAAAAQQQPHILGARQSIVAVPFGWPLRDHQIAGHQNKVLWVAKTNSAPLNIVATNKTTGRSVTKQIASGPGPSVMDVPTAGCWRFALKWADQHDEVFLRYYGATAPVATP